ncbi:hypothetical protein AQUCO_00500612v1 [Aquilegia coerulea]|uniref:F-box domain-containing protein n=1 Tax=Aquilegia coerulea TaxID=218851 RepID=A0A2G5ESR7_AQUCA|nr:hypothetical protein AQUCO_00500612v1 [Aquilegia coerulea]
MASLSSNLPDEVMMSILSGLPAKSLMRFKCVCKPWCELITSDSYFHRMRIQQAIKRNDNHLHPLTLFATLISKSNDNDDDDKDEEDNNDITDDEEVNIEINNNDECNSFSGTTITVLSHEPTVFKSENVFFDLPFHDNDFKLVGSCNGIVCLVWKNVVCLLNPYTREYKTVEFAKEFIFDRHTAYGFGYDTATEDYKLVLLIFNEIFVYSLNDVNSCFTISTLHFFINLPIGYPDVKDLGAFCNG